MQYNSCAWSIVTTLCTLGKSFIFIDTDDFLAEWFCIQRTVLQSDWQLYTTDIECVCVFSQG